MSTFVNQIMTGSSEMNPQQGIGSGVPTPDADMISELKADLHAAEADLHAADQTIRRQNSMIQSYQKSISPLLQKMMDTIHILRERDVDCSKFLIWYYLSMFRTCCNIKTEMVIFGSMAFVLKVLIAPDTTASDVADIFVKLSPGDIDVFFKASFDRMRNLIQIMHSVGLIVEVKLQDMRQQRPGDRRRMGLHGYAFMNPSFVPDREIALFSVAKGTIMIDTRLFNSTIPQLFVGPSIPGKIMSECDVVYCETKNLSRTPLFLHQLFQVCLKNPLLSLAGDMISEILLKDSVPSGESLSAIVQHFKVTVKREGYDDNDWCITTEIPSPFNDSRWTSQITGPQLEDHLLRMTRDKKLLIQLVPCIGFPVRLLDTVEGKTLVAEQYRKWWHMKVDELRKIKERDERALKYLKALASGTMGGLLRRSVLLIDDFCQMLRFHCGDGKQMSTKVLNNTDTLHDWRDFVSRFQKSSLDISTGDSPSGNTRITIYPCGHHICVHDIVPYIVEEALFTMALLYERPTQHESTPCAGKCLMCQQEVGTNCVNAFTYQKKRWCKEHPDETFFESFPKTDDFVKCPVIYFPGDETKDSAFQTEIDEMLKRRTV